MKKSDALDQCDLLLASLRAHLELLRCKTKGHIQVGRIGHARDFCIEADRALHDYRVNDTEGGE